MSLCRVLIVSNHATVGKFCFFFILSIYSGPFYIGVNLFVLELIYCSSISIVLLLAAFISKDRSFSLSLNVVASFITYQSWYWIMIT